MKNPKQFITNLKQAWRDEMNSAANYRAMAAQEKNPERKSILDRMADAEDKHAARWAARLKELGVEVGAYKASLAETMRRKAILKSDPAIAAQMLEDGEAGADSLYGKMIEMAESEEEKNVLKEVQLEENAHSLMLQEMSSPPVTRHPQSRLDKIFANEKWHAHSAGGWIGQAIYGINDGLGSAFGVVSGVAGATSATANSSEFILLSGLAACVASALSMGSGAYLATKSEREVYEAEVEKERGEIESNPDEEREELELFYQLKGLSPDDAKRTVAKISEKPEQLLKSLAHEELGLSEESFPNPWKSAFSATISTAIGAIVPVLPFFFWTGTTGLIISFVISTLAHFAVGASKTVLTGRSWMKSGMEMTFVGLGEAITTYLIGLLIAPALK
ncbi:MAG TPA: VIT1/CCC1 transporter family protein [Bacteroidota bacterium]|nr:VIT1/CCC1 transporter family protein [Bacteroidota bacterium]